MTRGGIGGSHRHGVRGALGRGRVHRPTGRCRAAGVVDVRVIHVSGLFIYPVKSCRGIALDEAEVVARGFRHDREWMVVDGDGRFLSQRTNPELARVAVRISDRNLVVTADGMPPLEVALSRARGSTREVTVWGDVCTARSTGRRAAGWFSDFLGSAVDLVRMPRSTVRPVDPRCAGPGYQVGFADGFPLLLISEESLSELNRRLDVPVPMDRFRPNIVVAGCPPHAEDGWRRLTAGSVPLRVAKPCSRCVVTTTDQRTGGRSPEPLRTLATYRKVAGEVLFGQNLVHEGLGRIRRGDACRVEID